MINRREYYLAIRYSWHKYFKRQQRPAIDDILGGHGIRALPFLLLRRTLLNLYLFKKLAIC
jgi:hypothetical protein